MSSLDSRAAAGRRLTAAASARDDPAWWSATPAGPVQHGRSARATPWLVRLAVGARAWLQARLERKFLEGLERLDERTLRDIGIRRIDLPDALARARPSAAYVLDGAIDNDDNRS